MSGDNQITLQPYYYCHKGIFHGTLEQTIHTVFTISMCLNYTPGAGRGDKAMREMVECLILPALRVTAPHDTEYKAR